MRSEIVTDLVCFTKGPCCPFHTLLHNIPVVPIQLGVGLLTSLHGNSDAPRSEVKTVISWFIFKPARQYVDATWRQRVIARP